MKTLRILTAIIFFATIGTISATAQTAAPATTTKIALIDTQAFGDPKAGITKYVAAATSLEAEFKPRRDKINTMQTQLQGIAKQIEDLTRQAAAPNTPVSQQTIDAKRAEGSKLQRDIQSEQATAQEAYTLRQDAVIGPVFGDISKAMQEYAKQNGYTVVFDLAKLAQSGVILAADEKADMTDAFIKFYNARPAGTAARGR